MRPIGEHVLCQVLSTKPKETAGGVLIPDTIAGRDDQAVVVAVGTGPMDKKGRRKGSSLKVHDVIWFDPYKLVWTEHSGVVKCAHGIPGELALIRESDVYGVVEPVDHENTSARE